MNGYLIAVIIMLIMFVGLMIRLMQEPVEEPLLLKPAPPPPVHQRPTAIDLAAPSLATPVTLDGPDVDDPPTQGWTAAQPYDDPLERLIAFERSSTDVSDTTGDLAPTLAGQSVEAEETKSGAEPAAEIDPTISGDGAAPTPSDEPTESTPANADQSE